MGEERRYAICEKREVSEVQDRIPHRVQVLPKLWSPVHPFYWMDIVPCRGDVRHRIDSRILGECVRPINDCSWVDHRLNPRNGRACSSSDNSQEDAGSEKPIGERRRPSADHCAFLRLASLVNTIATRRNITTNGIMPNSGIGA